MPPTSPDVSRRRPSSLALPARRRASEEAEAKSAPAAERRTAGDRQDRGPAWRSGPGSSPSTSTARRGRSGWRCRRPRTKNGEVASYIYQEGIATGLGSNPVGLDRGQLGDTRIVTLRRLGGRVLVEQPNLRFRALTEDAGRAAGGPRVVRHLDPLGRRDRRRGPRRAGAGRLHPVPGARRPRHRRAAEDGPAGELVARRRPQRGRRRELPGLPGQRGVRVPADLSVGRARVAWCARRRPRPARSPWCSTTRWCACPTPATSRGGSIRAPATSGSSSRTTRRRSPSRSTSASSPATGWRRSIRRRRARGSSSRSSTTSIPPRRSRSAAPWSRGRAGGSRPSTRRGFDRRLRGQGAAARRRSARRPLQRRAVGAPLDPRLVLRRRGDRSADRGDPQGARHPGLAARAAGPPDLRGAGRGGQVGHRRAGRSGAARARPHPPARRARGGAQPGPRPQLRRLAPTAAPR